MRRARRDTAPTQTATAVGMPKPGCPLHGPCNKTTCNNGGICRDFWTEKSCDCPPGYDGVDCSVQIISQFQTNGGGTFLYLAGNEKVTELAFSISALNASGLILYTVSLTGTRSQTYDRYSALDLHSGFSIQIHGAECGDLSVECWVTIFDLTKIASGEFMLKFLWAFLQR